MKNLFETSAETRIGKIREISGSEIKVEIDEKVTELTRSVEGRVYPIGQIGSIIKILFGKKILFAYVRMLRMENESQDSIPGQGVISVPSDRRIMEADLFAQGTWNQSTKQLSLQRGVETYPLPLQSVFLCIDDEIEEVYKGAEGSRDSLIDTMVAIGNYSTASNVECKANIDKLFGQHCAVLGSTGSGKSATVAAIIHSILEHKIADKKINPKIIIIDPHGEYAAAFKDTSVVYKAYNESSATDAPSEPLALPYWLMSGDEFRSLVIGKTEFEATSQANIIYQSLSYARMLQAGIIQPIGDDPVGDAICDIPATGKQELDVLNFDRDKPNPFLISELIKHIDKVQGRKPNNATNLPQSDSTRQKIEGILKKIKVLKANPQLKFLMDEYTKSSPKLENIIEQFVGEKGGKCLRIIDISGLPNEVAGPLTALISRLLFQYKLWESKAQRENDPILFVCEEAHRYVPNHGEAQYKEAQEAIRRIAKEGRKYGLGLMLVSQRPSDVEATVLSQCSSWIILRLTNASDQEHVSKFLPDSTKGLTRILPALTRREAIFVGEAAALPSRIKIRLLPHDKLPDSHDISFAKGWSNTPDSMHDIKSVTDKWAKS